MFFGRRETAERLPPDSLEELLDFLFGKRMTPLESRASGIADELRTAMEQFSEACSEFRELKAEPYTEDLWMPNINSIKSQKEQYAVALKEIANGTSLDVDASMDVYGRYRQLLANVEEMTNSVLRINAKFKPAFYCYSNYLGNFKKASAHIGRLTESLRNELDRRSPEYAQYSALRESILKLKLQGEELAALSGGVAALKSNSRLTNDSGVEKTESETRARLSAKASELSVLGEEISRLSNRINLLTAPLERPSKKLDHLTIRKKSLYGFVSDPINMIRNESEWRDFIELVQELKKNVDSGSIEAKNTQELYNSISALLNSDILFMINSLKDLERKRLDLNAEGREFERILADLSSGRESVAKSLRQIEKMERDVAEITKSRESLRAEIEKGFASYGKRISITL